MPEADLSFTITTIIALIALVSPILVALINNAHHSKIRKMELQKQMEQKQFDTYYSDKEKAYSEFAHYAGTLVAKIDYADSYSDLYSSIHKVLLLCDQENKQLLTDFINHLNPVLIGKSDTTQEWEEAYLVKLSALTVALNNELRSTANAISELYRPCTILRSLMRKFHK